MLSLAYEFAKVRVNYVGLAHPVVLEYLYSHNQPVLSKKLSISLAAVFRNSVKIDLRMLETIFFFTFFFFTASSSLKSWEVSKTEMCIEWWCILEFKGYIWWENTVTILSLWQDPQLYIFQTKAFVCKFEKLFYCFLNVCCVLLD